MDLPISSFNYGHMTSTLQNASVTIGDMICKGPKVCPVATFPLPSCDNKIRLGGSSSPNEGYIEIYHGWEWRGVCNHGFEKADADVICKMLGYPKGAVTYYRNSTYRHYGHGSNYDSFWVSNLRCKGFEEDITECGFQEWGQESCGYREWAGVKCAT